MNGELEARNGSELCLQCGMCCQGVLHSDLVILEEELGTFGEQFPETVRRGDHFASPLPCRHLDGARCTIYESGRPWVCGAYQCKLLKDYLGGRRELEDCLGAVREAKRMVEELAPSYLPQIQQSALDLGEALAPPPLSSFEDSAENGSEVISGERRGLRVWDFVGEFLAGNFEKHEGMKVDLRKLDSETLEKVAKLSYHLEANFVVSPQHERLEKMKERSGSDLCLSCGLCCQGHLHSRGLLEADEVGRFEHLLQIQPLEDGTPAFALPCPQLGDDNACQIYAEGRPLACGRFRCALLKDYLEGARELDECQALVQQVKAQADAPKAFRALIEEFFIERMGEKPGERLEG